MAKLMLIRIDLQLEKHGIKNTKLVKELAYDTAVQIISANPHANPFNSDGGSTMEYWMEVKEILTPSQQGEKERDMTLKEKHGTRDTDITYVKTNSPDRRDKRNDMKDTGYSRVTAAQREQDDHNRMMIAAKIMAAMVYPQGINCKDYDKDMAHRAVELADELIKALK